MRMKIEKHNAHGMQLLVRLSVNEALELVEKLLKTGRLVAGTDIDHYVTLPCQFEDDNDKWVPTELALMVEGGSRLLCQPSYPCGKHVEAMGSIPPGLAPDKKDMTGGVHDDVPVFDSRLAYHPAIDLAV